MASRRLMMYGVWIRASVSRRCVGKRSDLPPPGCLRFFSCPVPDGLRLTLQVLTIGSRPGPRGYHTANLVGNIMIVVGGSDGRECFSDIWVLNLGKW